MHDKWVRVFYLINDFNNTIRAISTSGIGTMQIHFIFTKVILFRQLLICFHEDSYNHTWYKLRETFHTCLLLLISILWPRQAIFESKGDKLSSSVECRIRTRKSQDTHSPADWIPTHKPTEVSRIKLKTWTQQPVPMMSEHSAHYPGFIKLNFFCYYRINSLLNMKAGDRRSDDFGVAGGTMSCHYDNSRCHRWRRACRCDGPLFSMLDVPVLNALFMF